MTNAEAQRILDEIRNPPRFVRGQTRYVVRKDGRVDLYRLTKADHAIWQMTVEHDWIGLHPDVRKALADGNFIEGNLS